MSKKYGTKDYTVVARYLRAEKRHEVESFYHQAGYNAYPSASVWKISPGIYRARFTPEPHYMLSSLVNLFKKEGLTAPNPVLTEERTFARVKDAMVWIGKRVSYYILLKFRAPIIFNFNFESGLRTHIPVTSRPKLEIRGYRRGYKMGFKLGAFLVRGTDLELLKKYLESDVNGFLDWKIVYHSMTSWYFEHSYLGDKNLYELPNHSLYLR